jgi:predicted nucleic acid-binding protein
VRTRSKVVYLDSSAIVKLASDEPESAALRRAVADWPRRTSSRVSLTEVLRAARRRGDAATNPARRVLAGVALTSVDRRVTDAVDVEPGSLSTLDAIHVASALALGDRLDAFVSYDVRQLEAATTLGMPVASPR